MKNLIKMLALLGSLIVVMFLVAFCLSMAEDSCVKSGGHPVTYTGSVIGIVCIK